MKKYARLFAVATSVVVLASAAFADSTWRVYEDCRLMQDEYYDGDSFHVKAGRAHYIFRLYFVDAPETSDAYSARVAEQAEYFDVDPDDIPELGELATRFTRRLLSRSFTVYTKKEDARGNSDRNRYFALVKVGRKWLGEELVANGLARIYGWRTELPDGLPDRKHLANLHVLERAAKRKRKGAWKQSGR